MGIETGSGRDRPISDAAGAYVGYLARLDRGEQLDFEAFCAEHSDLAEELRRLHSVLLNLQEGLPGASLSARLRARYGSQADPEIALAGGDQANEVEPASDFSSEVLGRLAERKGAFGRYALKGEIDRGGQGAILRVWDEDLRRMLAMKVLLGKDSPSGGATPPVNARSLGRFLEEAQVTGQLDHPGIVPVHELGLDSDGRVFFTMKLVKGTTLKSVLELVAEEQEGWTQTRALGVLSKVCEAMAYAHHKGVVHRDLKPANVMVGRFGEVYVMDWGLAKVLGREDQKDLTVAPQDETQELRPQRRARAEASPDPPLLTVDGDVLGTPAYMPPEQALGRTKEIGPHSDVYAVGAMLYHLLAGHMPYAQAGARLANREIWALVREGPPAPLVERDPQAPAELVAICERAMAREPRARYENMGALAADLGAYLEHRVVSAYETGTWAEARKWIARNKALAAALAAGLVLAVGGLGGIGCVQARERKVADEQRARADAKADEAARNAREAQANLALAQSNEAEARAQRDAVLSLSAQKDLDDLVAEAESLWPARPEMIPAYADWLRRAQELIDGRPADPAQGVKRRPNLAEHRARLAELRAGAKLLTEEGLHAERPGVGPAQPRELRDALTTEEPELWVVVNEGGRFEYGDPESDWWDRQLSKLVADLEGLRDPKTGLMGDTLAEPFGWGVGKRHEFARSIVERSVDGVEATGLWSEAIAAIRSSPEYGGLELTPQLGLLPIGMDPASRLWEFAHLQTGDAAVRGADGKLVLTEATGLVFVLIPGGAFWMGAQAEDPDGQNYDPQAVRRNEFPVHEVELSPYFMSKYEMTQGQWERITARNPSKNKPPSNMAPSLLHPVEQVNWTECVELLERLGLSLPTEAQWEHAARGGTSTPWWTGEQRESLRGKVNLADQTAKRGGAFWNDVADWPDLVDGAIVHAEVGRYQANPFGLHEVCGNVWEWCLDTFENYPSVGQKDPCVETDSGARLYRGSSFGNAAKYARSANRDTNSPEYQTFNLGFRPARSITP